MNVTRSGRGFELIMHEAYLPYYEEARLVQASSAVGDYDDSFARPGSSYLWVGDRHHLDREEVAELVAHLKAWLATGSLEVKPPETPTA